ncbi:CHAD domain-containing protein [Georgenia soli]|uniref:CHAD domain-containing protein n=1 Tax=Georgenia soli TaxID=638953 RepID=A0A2A9EK54_9MICO|nr:CYTH and CHAD domain-containing protein [Georgenia soli]PFG38635.1 CHAD domain-containing protein [Georgenia soli]
MRTQLEVERKFTVDDGFRPDRVPLADGLVLAAADELDLRSTYVDTPDLRLAARGVTLRRRTGGVDDGWHLKLPAGPDGRTEVHEPPGPEGTTPPERLRHLVAVHVRDGRLLPVARLRTRRAVYRITDGSPDAPVLAELVDDRVTAESLGEEMTVTTWRELEVELADGGADLLDRVEQSLRAAGAEPAPGPSKLLRALGDRVPHPAAVPEIGRRSTAADVVLAYVTAQVRALTDADPGVRLNTPDAVHQMRVASRRLRSALKTFRDVLDRGRTDPLRAELRWLAHVLGGARDTEVMHARVRTLLLAGPDDEARVVTVRRVDHELGERHGRALGAARTELDGARYFRVLDDLDALLADPHLTSRAGRPARKELPRRVRSAYRDVRRCHDLAEAASPGRERELALHEVRKAAKRARYAAEAVAPVAGKRARRFAGAMEEIQDVLGEHRDSIVTQEILAGTVARAREAGEDTFALGRVVGLEEAGATAAAAGYAEAWRAGSRKKLRAWAT